MAGTGEEGDHQRRLERRVERDRLPVPRVEKREQPGHGESARHRRRDVVAREERDESLQAVAGEQDDPGEGDGLDEI